MIQIKDLTTLSLEQVYKLAFEASYKVSENTAHYNPLYIYGGVGMGKTHLLNAIGYELKKTNKYYVYFS